MRAKEPHSPHGNITAPPPRSPSLAGVLIFSEGLKSNFFKPPLAVAARDSRAILDGIAGTSIRVTRPRNGDGDETQKKKKRKMKYTSRRKRGDRGELPIDIIKKPSEICIP